MSRLRPAGEKGFGTRAVVAALGSMGGGALLGIIGLAVILKRDETTVRQARAPVTARVPTWTKGLERRPADTSIVLPLLSGTF